MNKNSNHMSEDEVVRSVGFGFIDAIILYPIACFIYWVKNKACKPVNEFGVSEGELTVITGVINENSKASCYEYYVRF